MHSSWNPGIEYLTNGLIVISTPEAAIGVIKSSNMYVTNRGGFLTLIADLAKKIRNKELATDEMEVNRIREYYSKDKIAIKIDAFIKEFR